MQHGAIPVEESLKLALQIAEALEAAHEKGVIHRDLKPANIKVTHDGKIKVLDFGLAKAFVRDASDVNLSQSPTLSMAATQKGVILGTAAYMSPEQASGDTTDKRADIWSFGVVLFEMLTGRQTFDGKTVAHVLADVLRAEPEWNSLPPNLHPRLRLLLERCLEKEAKDRCHDVADVRVDIQRVLTDPAGVLARPIGPPVPAGVGSKLPWVVATAVGIVAAVVFATLWLLPAPLPEVIRFEINAPPRSTLSSGNPAISPDGRTLAYTVNDPDGERRIHLRPIDRVETRPLPGTEAAWHPFWSPDGRSLAFWAGGQLQRIDVAGGSPRRLAESPAPWHGTWNEYGDILFQDGGFLRRISEDGGAVTDVGDGEQPGSGFPAFFRDGVRFLSRWGNSIQLSTLDSTQPSVVLEDVSGAAIPASAPNGKTYLLFLDESDLMAQEFDDTSGSVRGDAVVLVPDVIQLARFGGLPAVGVSPTGILAYIAGTAAVDPGQLTWVDRSGKAVSTLPPDVSVREPNLSPDGSFVAGHRRDSAGNRDIWVTDLARGSSRRFTFDDEHGEDDPVWSPDGMRLAFRHTDTGIHIADVAGGGDDVHLTDMGSPTSWSPDSQYLLYDYMGTLTLQPVVGDQDPTEVGSPNGGSYDAQFSPDGNYIAFVSFESGREEVYVQPMPPATGQVMVSIDGGYEPRWSQDGTELFFLSPDRAMMAVDVEPGETFSPGVPQELFRTTGSRNFDVHPDGERFLILMPLVEAEDQTITVVLNWWVELEERVRER